MEPVSRLNKLLGVLRQKHASAQNSKATGSTKLQSNQKTTTTNAGLVQTRDINKLKSTLISRLRTLSNEDIQNNKAHTIFIETVLTWEFGADLLNDQNFSPIVDNLKDSMLQDAALKQMMDATLLDLANKQ